MKTPRKSARRNHSLTRRALVEALDSRKLMAADAGLEVCAPYEPGQDVAAETYSVQTTGYSHVEEFTDESNKRVV